MPFTAVKYDAWMRYLGRKMKALTCAVFDGGISHCFHLLAILHINTAVDLEENPCKREGFLIRILTMQTHKMHDILHPLSLQ